MAEAEILAVGAVVALAAAARALALAFRLPPVALYVGAGLAAQVVLPGTGDLLRGALHIALAFLLFAAGTRFGDVRRLRGLRTQTLAVAVVGTLATFSAGALAAYLIGWRGAAVAYAAAGAALSSTLLVHQWLELRDEAQEAHGRILMAALLAQDALALVLLAALPYYHEPALAARSLGALLLLGLAALVVGFVAHRRSAWRLVADGETRTLLAFAVALGFGVLAPALDLPVFVGAFVGGLALSVFPARIHARPAVRATREFFAPLFFSALGVLLPLPGRDGLVGLVALLGVALLLKPLFMALAARLAGASGGTSARVGAWLGHGSEFALPLVLLGVAAGHLDEEQSGLLSAFVALSMMGSTLLRSPLTHALARLVPRDPPPPDAPRKGHVLVLGAGETGRLVARELRAAEIPLLAVDVDLAALARLPPDVPRALADVTTARALDDLGVSRARAVIVLLQHDPMAQEALAALVEVCGDHPPPVVVRVHDETTFEAPEGLAVRILSLGEAAERAAEVYAERLMAPREAS